MAKIDDGGASQRLNPGNPLLILESSKCPYHATDTILINGYRNTMAIGYGEGELFFTAATYLGVSASLAILASLFTLIADMYTTMILYSYCILISLNLNL